MKTTLCKTCLFGLIVDWGISPPSKAQGQIRKCLLGNCFVEIVTSCNKYKKYEGKVTYHDPDFEEWEKESKIYGDENDEPVSNGG